MSGRFKNGASVNIHCKAKKLAHIRIKAGPQRDQYLHDLGNSLDNEPTNLIPVTRAENTRRMNERRWAKPQEAYGA